MRRREFIAGLGSAAVWPLAAHSQQSTLPLIGYLGLGSQQDPLASTALAWLHQGLSDTGYSEGKNVTIEYRWADGVYERMPDFSAEFVRRPVTIHFCG